MSILIRLANDNDIIFRNAGAPDSKVLITKFSLWCPKLIFNGAGMKQYLENYLKPKNLEISERASGNLPNCNCEFIFQNKYWHTKASPCISVGKSHGFI